MHLIQKYRFYSDGGHGWLEVSRKELEQKGLLNKVSGYSYQWNGMVYLEEDCDMSMFMKETGITFEHIDILPQSVCTVRNYPRFSLI